MSATESFDSSVGGRKCGRTPGAPPQIDSSRLSFEPPSITTFTTWIESQGITVHEHLQVVQDSTGCKVVAREAIPRNVVFPKDRLLSHRTSRFSDICNVSGASTAAEYTLHLTACLLYELRLGEESVYHGWLQLLPRETILLPTFWENEQVSGEEGQDALRWIKGTEVERELRRKDGEGLSFSDIESYFTSISSQFPSTSAIDRPPLLEEYLYAYSMISTRGYIVDAYHIMALVPFVDMFNHSNINHTSLLSDSDCCATCGSLPLCAHDDPTISPEESRVSRFSADYLAKVQEEGQTADMRVEREIEVGKEVFSCYEENLTAGKCLVEWGFFDSSACEVDLRWTAREVLQPEFGEVFMALLSRGRISAELDLENSPDNWIYITEDPGCFRIANTGAISLNLIIALYLRTLEEDPESIQVLEEALVRDLRVLRNGERAECDGLGQEIADLMDARIGAMFRPELSVVYLASEIQKSDQSSLSGMAMRLSLEERKSCQNVQRRWCGRR